MNTGKSQITDYYNQLVDSELIEIEQAKEYEKYRPIDKRKAILILYEIEKGKLGLSNSRFQMVNFQKINENTPQVGTLLDNQVDLVNQLKGIGLLSLPESKIYIGNITNFKYPSRLLIFDNILGLFAYKEEINLVNRFVDENISVYDSIVTEKYSDIFANLLDPKKYYDVLKIILGVKIIDLADYKNNDQYIKDIYNEILEGIEYFNIDDIEYEIIDNSEGASSEYESYQLLSKIKLNGFMIEYRSWIKKQEDIDSLQFFGMIGDDFHKVINLALNSISVDERIYRISFRSKSNRVSNYRNIAFAYLSPNRAKLIEKIPGFKVSYEKDSNFLPTSTLRQFIDSLVAIDIISIPESDEVIEELKSKFLVDRRQVVRQIPSLTVDGYSEGAFESDAYQEFFISLANIKNLDINISVDTVVSSGFNEGVIKLRIDDKIASINYNGIDDWFDLGVVDRLNQLLKQANSRGQFYGINTLIENGSYIFLGEKELKFFTQKKFFEYL